MKKKVLYMDMVWGFGGIESYMLNIFDNVDGKEFEFTVALPGLYTHVNEEALTTRGVRIIHYPATSIRQQIEEIRKILKEGQYDIIHIMQNHVSLENPAIFSLVSILERHKYHYKVINHAHNTEDCTRFIRPLKKIIRNSFRTILRFVFRKADILACCSQEAGAFLYGKTAKVHVFYNGVNSNRFLSAINSSQILDWRKTYRIPEHRTNFIIVARMAPQKNPMFVLDIIDSLRHYYPDILLTWVGGGDLYEQIVRQIETKGLEEHINLLGPQHNVQEILACCNYFLLPSKMEGAPLTLVEAQAAGLKCFASDKVPNIVNCGGVTFIELEKTADEWAEEIHRTIASNPKGDIQPDLLMRFEINQTVAALTDLYGDLIGDK